MDCASVIAVASLKGGTGTSTVSANLARTLAETGSHTLLIDCNPTCESQDLFFSVAETPLFDLCDIALGRATAENAFVCIAGQKRLYLSCASYGEPEQTFSADAMRTAIVELANACGAKYVVLDLPNAPSPFFSALASCCNCALIVSTLQNASLRVAERTNLALRDCGATTRYLLLNGLALHECDTPLSDSLLSAIDLVKAPLIGVLPYDQSLSQAEEAGTVSTAVYRADTRTAFSNLTRRLRGENVPLFTKFRNLRRRRVLKKL